MKKTFTLLLSIFIFSYLAKGEEEYIMLIGSTLADSSVEKIITDAGYKVYRGTGTYTGELSAEKIDSLNKAKLVIFSRNGSSGPHGDGLEEQWADIKAPILSLSFWIMRNNRWKWINSASNQCIQSDTIYVTEDGLNHPIFTNIKLGDNNSIPFTETGITRNESFVATEDVLTGASIKILAFDGVTDDSRVAIAEFEAGYNFYADAPAPSSNRMFIALTEGDNCKLENVRPNVMSAFNGTEQGKTILLNAIAYLMGKEITKVKNVNANNLNVFPNPVVNYITVNNIKGQVGYKIYNMNGAVVLKGTTSSTINVASLNSGLYMVVLDNGMCSKFIKK